LFQSLIKNLNLWQTIKKARAEDKAIQAPAVAAAATKARKAGKTHPVRKIPEREMTKTRKEAVTEVVSHLVPEIQEKEAIVSSLF
jgi:hypothetical protein